MTTLKEAAQAYEPKQIDTKNVADLEIVPVEAEILEYEGETKEGKKFKYNYIVVDGENYRVPNIVLDQLKIHTESNPNLSKFRVNKSGEGINTKYTVVPIL